MAPFRLVMDSFWFSPYSFSAFVGLTEKGIPFEIQELALHKQENKTIEYRKSSITGRIPAIQHGEFWLAESGAIIEYLDDVLPTPSYKSLLPQKLEEKAKARMILAWIRSSRDLMPLITERSTETMFYERAKSPLSEAGQKSAEKLIEFANLLLSESSDFLFDSWCIADTDLAFALHRLILNHDPVPRHLKQYAEVQWQRPSAKAFIDRPRPDYVSY
jgi:glutathione S-transferase